MTLKSFSKICLDHHFKRDGDKFCRIVGDGVFQMIYIGSKEKFRADHPLYTATHRYDRCVVVYIKSMYSECEPDGSNIDDLCGYSFQVHNMQGVHNYRFEGSSYEYDWMAQYGFNILNQIDTQEKLEDYLFHQMNNSVNEDETNYDYRLFDIFLRCGHYYMARMAVAQLYAHNCLVSYGCGKSEEEILKETNMSKFSQRYMITWPRYREAVSDRLKSNYSKNMQRVAWLGLIDN